MSLEIYVDAYAGYKANERPRQFTLDEDTFEIAAVEAQWRSQDAAFFKVRTTEGKHYLLSDSPFTSKRAALIKTHEVIATLVRIGRNTNEFAEFLGGNGFHTTVGVCS